MPSIASTRTKLLLASDDIAVANRLDCVLSKAGYDVDVVTSVHAARARIGGEGSYALIIVDFRLADGCDVDLVLDSAPVIIVGVTTMSHALRSVIEHRGGTIVEGPINVH
jgi:DNA-binding response OmpR family regulator